MKTAMIGLMILSAAFPGGLASQTPEVRIESARARLIAAGIDTRLVDLRVAEGRAKGASVDVIARVVENRTDALINSAAALRPIAAGVTEADLAAGADAIEAGIPASAIQQVVRAARAEDRSVALSVLTYLHREQSLPLETAIDNVRAALERGPQALRELPAQANAFGRDGSRPPAAGSAGPGQQPGVGPPSGVPGPEGRPRGRGPDGAGPPGQDGRSGGTD